MAETGLAATASARAYGSQEGSHGGLIVAQAYLLLFSSRFALWWKLLENVRSWGREVPDGGLNYVRLKEALSFHIEKRQGWRYHVPGFGYLSWLIDPAGQPANPTPEGVSTAQAGAPKSPLAPPRIAS